jgi:hypothetical protein
MPEEEKSALTPEEEERWEELEANEKRAEEGHQPCNPIGTRKELQTDDPQAENNNDDLPPPEQVNPTDSQQEISACFEAAIKKLDKVDSDANKKRSEIVQELARDLEGKMPTDEIAAEIVQQLRGRIAERRVYECLEGDQYAKYKKKHRVQNAQKRSRKDQPVLAAEPQLKQQVVVLASGQEAVVAIKPEETSGGNGGGSDTYTNTSPSPSLQRTSTTDASEPSSIIITASTLPHTTSVCENCSARIKELEDMNRKQSTRNAELDLQLTNQGKYIDELLGKNKELEQALAVSSMKSAEELMHTSTDWYQQSEFSVPFEPLRRHMVFFNGINGPPPDRVWFNGKFNRKTGEVIDVRIGRRTDTDITDNSRMTP